MYSCIAASKRILFFLNLSLLLILNASLALAAPASRIVGVVKDANTGEPLPGANIIIVGTAIGSSSGLSGEFAVNAVPTGDFTLRVTFIGYETKEMPVKIAPDAELKLEVALASTYLEAEAVVVSAQREGQVAAINQQLSADALVNVVSSEKILEVPDANTAESIARLPGVSIQRDGGEGSQVVVRGLSPKYSKVTIDGIEMAATSELSGATDSDPTDNEETRSTNLSAISQENLKGIELFKAPTADMDGDAIGGTVNLQTAPAGSTPERIVRGYGSYNSLENDYEQYDVFGKVSQRLLDHKLGLQLSVNTERRNRSSDLFSGSYSIDPQRQDPVTGLFPINVTNASVEDRLETRKRSGGSLILDYNLDQGNIILTNFYSKTTRNILSRVLQVSATGGGLLRTAATDRSLEQMLNMLRGEHRLFGLNVDWVAAHSYSHSELPFDHILNFTGPIAVPTPRQVTRDTSAIGFFNRVPGVIELNLNTANPAIDDVEERNYVGGLNLSYDFTLDKNLAGMIRFGGKIKHLDRSRTRTRGQLWAYLTLPWSAMTSANFLDNSYRPHDFLDGDASLGTVLDAGANRTFYNTYSDSTQYVINEAWAGNNDYDINENLRAGYVMAKLNYKQLLTFVPGIRYEAVDNDYLASTLITEYSSPPPVPRAGADFFVYDTTTSVNYHDWMPMVHLKIKPLNWFDLRLSLTRTIARPDFNDVMPFQNLTTNPESSVNRGNPDLEPVRAWNYDAYASFYNSFWGLFTVGAFYKSLEGININYRVYVADQDRVDLLVDSLGLNLAGVNTQYGQTGLLFPQTLTMPINLPESGEVRGVEFEIQTNLRHWPIPGFLKGVVLGFNYAIIDSKIGVRDFEARTVSLPVPPFFRTDRIPVAREIPVPGQADRLANLSLGYDMGGFSARVSMFHQSGSLRDIGVLKEQDGYDGAFTRWDLSVRQRISSRLEAYFNIVNLTETRDRRFVFQEDRPTRLESFGRTADLGLQFRL
ncbi:MAG TPA: TonB-dependent receptor [bacterium]